MTCFGSAAISFEPFGRATPLSERAEEARSPVSLLRPREGEREREIASVKFCSVTSRPPRNSKWKMDRGCGKFPLNAPLAEWSFEIYHVRIREERGVHGKADVIREVA